MELEELVQRIERWKQRKAREEAGIPEDDSVEAVENKEESQTETALDTVESVDSRSIHPASWESEEEDLNADFDFRSEEDSIPDSTDDGDEADIEPISLPPEDVMELAPDSTDRDNDKLN
jgi:hypothetical protein